MTIHHAARSRRRQAILDHLAAGPADVHQLAEAMFLTKQNAHKHLARLRAEPVRVIRIAHWESDAAGRKYPHPYYGLGSEPDAEKPVARRPVAKKRGPKTVAAPPQFADPLAFWNKRCDLRATDA